MTFALSERVVDLPPGEIATREIDLEAGQFLHAVVIQDGVDVVLRLRSLTTETLATPEVDSPYGRFGPEELLWIADHAGRFELSAKAPSSASEGSVRLESLTIRSAIDRDRELVAADGDFRAGRVHFKDKDYEAADEALGRALSAFQRLGERRRTAECLDELALRWEDVEDFQLTVSLSHRAAAGWEKLGDERRQARSLGRSGHSLLGLSAPNPKAASALEERAVADLRRCVSLRQGKPDLNRTASLAAGRLGTIYRRQGSLENALEAQELSLQLSQPSDKETHATALFNLAQTLRTLHQYSKARSHYLEAAEAWTTLPEHSGNLISALAGAADMAGLLGKHEEAKTFFDRASSLAESSSPASPPFDLLLTEGRLHSRRQQWPGAERSFRRALSLAEKEAADRSIAAARIELGNILLKTGNPSSALELFVAAAANFERVRERSGQASALTHEAKALAALGFLENAADRLAQSLGIVESLRVSSARSDVRQNYWGKRQNYFEAAINNQMAIFRRDGHHDALREALRLHEGRRARELRDRLNVREPSQPAPIDPKILQEEAEIEANIVELAVESATGPRNEVQLEKEFAKLDRVRGRISAATTESAPFAFSLDSFMSKELDPGSLALVYALGDAESWLFRLQKDGNLAVYSLPPRETIEGLATQYLRAVRGETLERGAVERVGRELWSALLDPLGEELEGQHLIIVADGSLEMLPFAALTSPEHPDRFLVSDHQITYLPSLSSLILLRSKSERRGPRTRTLVAFGDPIFDKSPSKPEALRPPLIQAEPKPGLTTRLRSAAEDHAQSLVLVPLPNSRTEIESIRPWFSAEQSDIYLGPRASGSAFRALSGQPLGALHLATHAIVNPEHPGLSALAFSGAGAAEPNVNDSSASSPFVFAFEIANFSLEAELVCLSACDTGRGQAEAGEGVLALARSFLGAGATRVVASSWSVGDETTSRFMGHFYEALFDQGLAPGAALRAAQLEMLASPETADLYAWAPFVLHGDWRSPNWTPED